MSGCRSKESQSSRFETSIILLKDTKDNTVSDGSREKMVSTSPYDLIESAPPKWRPQEDRAASAIVGITYFLFLETIFEIFRVFKKRKGLYFWSLFASVVACCIDNIAITLKFLVPGSSHVWPLYTLMALAGWTVFSLGQLTVLYSRLHLVVDNDQVQRRIQYLIFACAFLLVLPTWIVVWPAYNIDPVITKRWSPADASVERFTQLGFTLAECIVSGVYIHALLHLLSYKPTVRQRRVFLDLVYVNVATILLDILGVILVYLNQTGTSHPIQTFSYMLKLRLEFAVLNQLMAVAARGLRRETFGEKRYHNNALRNPSYHDKNLQMLELGDLPDDSKDSLKRPDRSESSKTETPITVPAPVLEEMGSQSRSREVSGDDSFLPLQGQRSDAADNPTKRDGPGSKGRAIVRSLRPGSHFGEGGNGVKSTNARRTRNSTSRTDDDDEDDIPLHMWERNGEVVLGIPWLAESRRCQVQV